MAVSRAVVVQFEKSIGRLLQYAQDNHLIEASDWSFARNRLLEVLDHPSYDLGAESREPIAASETVDDLLRPILDEAIDRGVIEVDTVARRDQLDAAIMGALLPRHSTVSENFWQTYAHDRVAATDEYYQLSIAGNYIRKPRTDKNLQWQHPSQYGEIQMTVNVSKPEKDPRDIAAAGAEPDEATKYPACLLCPENEGYPGRLDYPARQNLRLIDLELPGNEPSGRPESWFMQYSPYLYYQEHSIFLSGVHRPMAISRAGLDRLLTLITLLPHYFVGSNADLPIVGGSILSHDHFQGGRHRFPIQDAPAAATLAAPDLDLRAEVLQWPLATIRLTGSDPVVLAQESDRVIGVWRGYDDRDAGVLAETDGRAHNAITPIARRVGNDYQVDLVLRNNRTSPQHPLGVFHPHAQIHPVKRENIGLIEVMGLAVLPARLLSEMTGLAEALLAGDSQLTDDLAKHQAMYQEMRRKRDPGLDAERAQQMVREAVSDYFVTGLEHCGVFGQGDDLIRGVARFAQELGWQIEA